MTRGPGSWRAGAVPLGVGTAMACPTLLADGGFAAGALLTGVIAHIHGSMRLSGPSPG